MAGSVGGVSHPLRTASAGSASASSGLLVSLGGPISATTQSRSVTRTVSPDAASRMYSLNRLFNTFIPTALMCRRVATSSDLVKLYPLDGRLRALSALAIVPAIPFGRGSAVQRAVGLGNNSRDYFLPLPWLGFGLSCSGSGLGGGGGGGVLPGLAGFPDAVRVLMSDAILILHHPVGIGFTFFVQLWVFLDSGMPRPAGDLVESP